MYKCEQCPQTFWQKGNLVSHVAKCHTFKEGQPNFPCNKCSCGFRKLATLNAHISKFHALKGVFDQAEDGFTFDDVMQQLSELHQSNPMGTELISKEIFSQVPAATLSISEKVNIISLSLYFDLGLHYTDGKSQNQFFKNRLTMLQK